MTKPDRVHMIGMAQQTPAQRSIRTYCGIGAHQRRNGAFISPAFLCPNGGQISAMEIEQLSKITCKSCLRFFDFEQVRRHKKALPPKLRDRRRDVHGRVLKHGARQWWPAEYADELMAEGKASPNDWIVRRSDGTFALLDSDWEDAEDGAIGAGGKSRDNQATGSALFDGQKIEFMFCEDLGTACVLVGAGDSQDERLKRQRVHEEATQFWLLGGEIAGDTIEEFLQEYVDSRLPHGIVEVRQAKWSGDGDSTTFAVKIEGDRATFVQAGIA